MADKTEIIYSANDDGEDIHQLYKDLGNGTDAQYVQGMFDLRSDLKIGAKSLNLTLSGGVGSVPIPNDASIIGVKPVSSTTMRVGLEAPEANGAATGTAVSGDLKKGVPVDAEVWTWFASIPATGRILHISGGASDVITVVVM